jgi:hypothetical protein
MTSPKWAVDINRTRWYRHPTRHQSQPVYRSITSVVGALPKAALPNWAANTVAEYAVTHLDAWEKLPASDAYDLLRRVPWQNRDRAAAKGSEVHEVMDAMMHGVEFEVEATIEPWIDAASAFIRDTGPTPLYTETTVYNERHLFAGSFDFLGRLAAFPELGRVLIDWKTSKGVYPDMGVQVVGGYALGAEYLLDRDDTEQEWQPPDSAAVVHLTEKGYEIRPVPMHPDFKRAFLAALEIRKWEKEGPKLGPPLEVPENWNVVLLRGRVSQLTQEQRLACSLQFKELGLPTNPARLSPAQVEEALAVVSTYLMSDPDAPVLAR